MWEVCSPSYPVGIYLPFGIDVSLLGRDSLVSAVICWGFATIFPSPRNCEELTNEP